MRLYIGIGNDGVCRAKHRSYRPIKILYVAVFRIKLAGQRDLYPVC